MSAGVGTARAGHYFNRHGSLIPQDIKSIHACVMPAPSHTLNEVSMLHTLHDVCNRKSGLCSRHFITHRKRRITFSSNMT